MIARRCISVIMTALVLGCPLQCADCCGACWNQAYADSGPSGCGGDAECNCDRDEQLPCDHDREGSKEADCFCNGAVLSDGTKCPDLDVPGGFLAVLAINTSSTRQSAGTSCNAPARHRSSHFPPLVSGRDICTLVNFYLL